MKRSVILGYVFIILSAIIFGCNPLFVRVLHNEGLNSVSLVLLRNMLSIPVLAVLAYRQHGSLVVPVKALPSIGMIAVMGCCVTPMLLISSYSYIASGTATVFHFNYPAAVVLAGVCFFRERISRGNLISVILCVVGICLFYDPTQPLNWKGSFFALLSGITYAIYILQLSHFRFPQISGFLFSLCINVVSCIVMFLVSVSTGMLTIPATLTGWAACFAFSIAVSVCAVVMFQQGTFYIGGQKASILSTLEPITSLFVGAVVFHEAVGIRTVFGSVLVIFASILIAVTDMKTES